MEGITNLDRMRFIRKRLLIPYLMDKLIFFPLNTSYTFNILKIGCEFV